MQAVHEGGAALVVEHGVVHGHVLDVGQRRQRIEDGGVELGDSWVVVGDEEHRDLDGAAGHLHGTGETELAQRAVQHGLPHQGQRVADIVIAGGHRGVATYTTDVSGESTPLRPEEFSSAVAAITSAFGDPTRRRIYLFAREGDEGVTASEVAARFGLHANVARHHLDKLAAGGHLEVRTGRAGGGAGRPSKRYVAGEAMTLDVPVRRDDLVLTLLARALDLLAPDAAEAMAEHVGIEYGRAMAASLQPDGPGQRSFRSALHAVADALTAHGFAAHADEGSIISETCPFAASVSSPVICAVDRGMVKGMLAALYGDTAPETASSRAAGDDTCVTAVALSR